MSPATEQATLEVKPTTKTAPIELTEKAAAEVKRIVAEQASPEALVLSATLRALMLESRTDVTAALRE